MRTFTENLRIHGHLVKWLLKRCEMAQEGDWIYTLDEELHERLRDNADNLDRWKTEDVARVLIAISLSRIALTFENTVLDPELPIRVEVKKK